ncbi:MAG: hypothetical protein V1729_07160 [Candidatus Woesearchaeota archaeon]
MTRPDKRKIDHLKQEDKELSKLPELDKEDTVLKKEESFLKRLLRTKKVKIADETIHHPKEMQLKKQKKR